MKLARLIRARLGLAEEGVRAAGDLSAAIAVNVAEEGATTVASRTEERGRVTAHPEAGDARSSAGRTSGKEER